MKKVLLIIVCVIVLTGCNATYKLKIDKNTIDEFTTIEERKLSILTQYCEKYTEDSSSYENCMDKYKSFSDRDILIYYTDNVQENGIIESNEIYNTKHNISNQINTLFYEYNYNIDDYTKSTILNYCFDNFKFNKTEYGSIKIDATGKITCGNEMLESIKLEVSSNDYDIVNDNADKKESGKYIWNVNLKNNNDIHFELKEKVDYTPYIVIGFIILLIILLISFIIFRKISIRNNRI